MQALSSASPILVALAICVAAVILGYWRKRQRPGVRAKVEALYIFPVKSCAGIAVMEAEVGLHGFKRDREWCVARAPTELEVVTHHSVVTIREFPAMATLVPSFSPEGDLVLTTPAGASLTVKSPPSERLVEVLLWRTKCHGADQGAAVSRFLSDFLGCDEQPVVLLRMEASRSRDLGACPKYKPLIDAVPAEELPCVSKFSDWSPLSVMSAASIRWCNASCGVAPASCGPTHFRPNIFVETGRSRPFEEDTWQEFTVGEVRCRFLKHTGRCQIPTVDPATGERNKRAQPLIALKKLRAGVYTFLSPDHENYATKEAFLGTNVRHLFRPGQRIRVGDAVTVSGYRDASLVAR